MIRQISYALVRLYDGVVLDGRCLGEKDIVDQSCTASPPIESGVLIRMPSRSMFPGIEHQREILEYATGRRSIEISRQELRKAIRIVLFETLLYQFH